VLLARREEWVTECKGLETANETTERTKTRSEVGLRMAGDSRRKEWEGEERNDWEPWEKAVGGDDL
jgi:hypothetical protein